MKKFLNTMAGSWLKVFSSTVLAEYLILMGKGISIFEWNMQTVEALVTAGVVAVLPIIINVLNSSDTRYGLGSKK
jgi:hypothetical protein